ncbi:MAG TPA: ATP-binding cassette domain-containing protein [Burkholderiales bacterium]|nr:ATP-binding cassette domain-containing protein [Burkholderiales bacterium]
MLAVRGLAHTYGSRQVLRVDDWQVAAGERALVLGPSGSGKSTLLHVLAGLLKPTAGSVFAFDEEISSLSGSTLDRWRGRNVGIVLQALHLVSHLTVRANLRLAQYLARLPQDDAAIDRTLAALGVADKAARRPGELSQGEQQRVAVARAVVNGPKLLLADEPTSSLDDEAAARAIDLLTGEAARTGATLVVVTHDARVKRHFAQTLELGR